MRLSELMAEDKKDDSQSGRLSQFMVSNEAPAPEKKVEDVPSNKPNIIDFWTGGKEEIPIDRPYARAAYQTAKDISAIPAHFINQLLLNYPRVATEKVGFAYPERTEAMDTSNKSKADLITSAAPYAAGIVGGIKNPLIKAAGYLSKVPEVAALLSKVPSTLKVAGAGAALSGAYATDNPKDIPTNMALGASFGAAGSAISRGLAKIASANPAQRISEMTRMTQSLHNAYEDGVKYVTQGGKRVEVSNPIKTIAERKLIPIVKNGRADATNVIQGLNDEISSIAQTYKQAIDPEKTVPISQLKSIVVDRIKASKEIRNLGAVESTIKKADTILNDYKKSYGRKIPLTAIDDIRITMNSRFDPELRDVYRSFGDASRKIIYDAVPEARTTLSKEGELLAARNFAEKMNNKPIKGGRLGNYVGQTIGAIIGSSTQIPVVGPAIGALGGNALSQRLQQLYFKAPMSGPAGFINKGKQAVIDSFLKEAQTPYGKLSEELLPSVKKAISNNRGSAMISEGSTPLHAEALKYKTPEEFIRNARGNATQYGKYSPQIRATSKLFEDSDRISNLGVDPEKEITIYRGVPDPKTQKIVDGDFVVTDRQSAESYAGKDNVISKKVKAKDLITDSASEFDKTKPFGLGAEFIYSDSKNNLTYYTDAQLNAIWNEAHGKKINPMQLTAGVGTTIAGGAMAGNANAAQNIDMNKIYQIESSGNPQAHNKSSNARGLGQITPIVLKEWNNFHPKNTVTSDQLFDGETNKKISDWYMNSRIPQLLKHYNIPDTEKNRIIAYNSGIATLKNNKPLPEETKKYLKKYGI